MKLSSQKGIRDTSFQWEAVTRWTESVHVHFRKVKKDPGWQRSSLWSSAELGKHIKCKYSSQCCEKHSVDGWVLPASVSKCLQAEIKPILKYAYIWNRRWWWTLPTYWWGQGKKKKKSNYLHKTTLVTGWLKSFSVAASHYSWPVWWQKKNDCHVGTHNICKQNKELSKASGWESRNTSPSED